MKHFPAEPLHICHRFYPKRSAAFLCCVDLTLPCIIKPAEEDKQDKIHTFTYETQKGVLELLNQWAVNKEERECVWKRSWSLFSLLQNHRNRLLIVSDELLDHSWILGGPTFTPEISVQSWEKSTSSWAASPNVQSAKSQYLILSGVRIIYCCDSLWWTPVVLQL